MSIRKILLFSVALCLAFSLNAQYHNQRQDYLRMNGVWAFGSLGINMNTTPPATFSTGMIANGGTASVADPKTGELLFYTSGRDVFTKNKSIMPNGKLLSSGKPSSPDQATCIVPFIGAADKYYVFTVELNNKNTKGRLTYSIVDMALNGGLGDVVSGSKDIVMDTLISNALVTVPGDDCDVWLITHRRDTSLFYNYRISKNGIDLKPVISNVGPMTGTGDAVRLIPALLTSAYGTTITAVSPDRKKLAIASVNVYNNIPSFGVKYTPNIHGILLCAFDPGSGIVNNALLIDSSLDNGYVGLCFSPDNSKLYFTADFDYGSVFQFDVSTHDSARVRNSLTEVYSGNNWTAAKLKLYNESIYTMGTNAAPFYRTRLARINKPNLAGTACDFQDTVKELKVTINETFNGAFELPNDVVYPFPPDTTYMLAMDTVVCTPPEFTLQTRSNLHYYRWDDGSTGASRDISQYGTYWVTSGDSCYNYVDTFVVDGEVLAPVMITINGFVLSTSSKYASYQWYKDGELLPSETRENYQVVKNGVYQVKVTNRFDCSDSAEYVVSNVVLSKVTSQEDRPSIYPNPSTGKVYIVSAAPVNVILSCIDGRVLRHAQAASPLLLDISDLAEGVYVLRIYNEQAQLLQAEKLIKVK
jgi:hypothetical protein